MMLLEIIIIIIVVVAVVLIAASEDKGKNSYSVSNNNINNNTNPTCPKEPKLYRTNILTIDDEKMSTKSAYFSDGKVYTYFSSIKTESLIGTYDCNGVVYDPQGYELGKILGQYGSIMLTRNGDLERCRVMMFNKHKESDLNPSEKAMYLIIAKKTMLVWIPAEVFDTGGIVDSKTDKLIAKPEYIYENEKSKLKGHQCFVYDGDHKIGYGACFICLLSMTGNSGTYADFYGPLGETFVEPY